VERAAVPQRDLEAGHGGTGSGYTGLAARVSRRLGGSFHEPGPGLGRGAAEWGDFRIAFLQYASDPITFFSTGAAWREPDWMREPRGPDVSSDLRWFPMVTMLQLAADMMVGTAPTGFGHEYAPPTISTPGSR
jgi:uncharacterized membrane protein